MTIKNTTLSFFLLLSMALFSQNSIENKKTTFGETKVTYLDSIKKTFVKYDTASRADSLWMNQVAGSDIYTDLENDINTVNLDKDIDKELPTELLKARLAAMDSKSPFNIEYNQGLENLIKSFLKNRRKAFEHQMAISEYYFPIFEDALAKQNVPLEIKYLAVVESALNPKAVSRVGATGLWQFMYQTGKQYNLNIDTYVDERSDPLKSSEAAAQYMTNMYAIFGDWDLVLASYNSGPGNVTKAIRRSGGQRNFWNIKKNLPKETQGYLPAFLATMYIYEYHTAHGIVPKRALVKQFATDTIMIKKEMSFTQISNLLDIPVEQLQALNPSYKRNIIPFYNDKSHYLTLPHQKIAVFTSNEDKIYAYTEYELNRREKTSSRTKAIAQRDTTSYTSQPIAVSKTKYYKVKSGDNLSEIATKYDVAVTDIKKWNKLKGSALTAGKSLRIITNESIAKTVKKEPKIDKLTPVVKMETQIVASDLKTNESTDTLATNTPHIYVVQKGDNLGNIAKKFGTTLADLKQWNNLPGNTLSLGKTLIVTKTEVAIASANATVDSFKKKENTTSILKNNDINYLVKKGDSLFSISKKYPGVTITDIKNWNDITGEDIKPGMALKIKG